MSSNPIRDTITEHVFKGYHVVIRSETRDDRGEVSLSTHVLRADNYRSYSGWQATDTGIVFNSDEVFVFVPYHRFRFIDVDDKPIWNHNEPKKVPKNVPLRT